jgi:hypothetical protein
MRGRPRSPRRAAPRPHAPDFDGADAIGAHWGNLKTRTFAELLIDCEEDETGAPASHRSAAAGPVTRHLTRPTASLSESVDAVIHSSACPGLTVTEFVVTRLGQQRGTLRTPRPRR